MIWYSMTFLPIIAIATRFDCETKLNDPLNWRNRVAEQLGVAVELKTNHHSELQYNCDLERKVKAGATSSRVLLVTFKNSKDIVANAGREMENLLSNSMLEVSTLCCFDGIACSKLACKPYTVNIVSTRGPESCSGAIESLYIAESLPNIYKKNNSNMKLFADESTDVSYHLLFNMACLLQT